MANQVTIYCVGNPVSQAKGSWEQTLRSVTWSQEFQPLSCQPLLDPPLAPLPTPHCPLWVWLYLALGLKLEI